MPPASRRRVKRSTTKPKPRTSKAKKPTARKAKATRARKPTRAPRTSRRATKGPALPPPQPLDEFGAAGGVPMAPTHAVRERRSTTKELSWSEFERKVQVLARTVASRFKPQVVVGLAHGGVFVGDALARALKVDFVPVHLVRRSRDHASHVPSGIAEDMPSSLTGQRVLIVDDIASSGDSLEFALRLAQQRKAKALATAVLVARPGRYQPTYAAETSDAFFVFPWDYQSLVDDARFMPQPR